MLDNGFTFGKKSTWDFPIMKVEKYPSARGGIRKYQTYSIPGRNGDLHVDEGAFQNYTQPYECYYHTDMLTNEMAHAVKAWLLASGGYQRLVDAYDPTHYRLGNYNAAWTTINYVDHNGNKKSIRVMTGQ